MKIELFQFQKKACATLRDEVAEALGAYHRRSVPQVISFTAPTGAGKTIIMASLIEDILCGVESFVDQPEAIFVWLSDSPQLNEQSKTKIETKADRIQIGQCVTIADDSFDQEMLDDGHIYFLNTQKLGKGSNLTKKGDSRTYTIWETLAKTVEEKSDRLYFIIDEAHRGAQGKDAATATTIMQKFIKGSEKDGIPPMPVVIGMSATSARFNALVGETASTIHKCVVTADEVRASGLLKDRIIFKYPGNNSIGSELAVLQAAADNWKEKWDHWQQYCREQHYAYVNPVFVVQVLDGTNNVISHTNLDDCLDKIEERVGQKFSKGEVVHTFGQTNAEVNMNGLDVPYVEPSQIAEDRCIKVVFFKQNLSTGWDCPRAETMMSFRAAKDSTYIAQLLGRMVRTPMQMHIQVDDVLNDVHLYLPNFDETTVDDVVNALQKSEGEDLPTEVMPDNIDSSSFETWTTTTTQEEEEEEEEKQPTNTQQWQQAVQTGVETTPPVTQRTDDVPGGNYTQTTTGGTDADDEVHEPSGDLKKQETHKTDQDVKIQETKKPEQVKKKVVQKSTIDRDAILKFINQSGLLSYDVRIVKVAKNYRASLNKLANLLVVAGLNKDAVAWLRKEIVEMIHRHVEELKAKGTYEEMTTQVRQFELKTQIFDAFGQSLAGKGPVQTDFTTTDADVERQFRIAGSKLGIDGIGYAYGNMYGDEANSAVFKIDVILFASDEECMEQLEAYCKQKFHTYNDDYRRKFAMIRDERLRKQYDDIVSDSDVVTEHNFRIPEKLQVCVDRDGKVYSDHLLVNPEKGYAKIKLNSWEDATIEEERNRPDYVCWLRNPSRGSWALCIPYKMGNVTKAAYPDLIVIRRDEDSYVIDVLEPHQPTLEDNFGKAQGFAEYARKNPGLGRIQLLRMSKDVQGHDRLKRLDMSKSEVRDKIMKAMNQDELNHLFDTDGHYDTHIV